MNPKSEADTEDKLEYAGLPKAELRQADLYRALKLTADKKVQGGDIVNFVEELISWTEARLVVWKLLSKNAITLELAFKFAPENKTKEINPEDIWRVKVQRIFRPRKLLPIRDATYAIEVSNRYYHFDEDIGQWLVPDKMKEPLAVRLGKLMETVFFKVYGTKKYFQAGKPFCKS